MLAGAGIGDVKIGMKFSSSYGEATKGGDGWEAGSSGGSGGDSVA